MSIIYNDNPQIIDWCEYVSKNSGKMFVIEPAGRPELGRVIAYTDNPDSDADYEEMRKVKDSNDRFFVFGDMEDKGVAYINAVMDGF